MDDPLPLRSADPAITFPGGAPATFFMDRMATAFRHELEAFTKVVAGEPASPRSVADGLAASWIAEACTVSWRERRPVQSRRCWRPERHRSCCRVRRLSVRRPAAAGAAP